MARSPRVLIALVAVFIATPPIVFGSMKPGWNSCSADLAWAKVAHLFPSAPLAPEEMHYVWAGKKDGPVLVLLHGMDSATVTFENVYEALGAKYRLLVVDLRGHGKTPDRGLDYSPRQLADDVIALTQYLGVKHFHLLGHSHGARVGLRLVERAPTGTVLSFIAEDMSFEKRYDLEAATEEVLRRHAGRKAAYDKPDFDRSALIADMADRMFEGSAAHATSVVARRTRPTTAGRVELLYRPWVSALIGAQAAADEGREVLKNVAIPVLDLRAESGDDSAARGPVIPPARLVHVAGAGHVIHRDEAVAFVREVFAFLDGVTQSEAVTKNPDSASKAIADAGTTADAKSRAVNLLPRGSALVTSSGALAATGIQHIVHAATGSARRGGDAFDPTLESVRLSILNSLALAKQVGGKRVALPFIGGKIFLDRIGTTPEILAQTIVQAALDGRGDLEICFVLFDDGETSMFQRLLATLQAPTAVQALKGNIVLFSHHRADIIVNAANTEVEFGNGVSGAIGRASGQINAIDAEARRAIAAYYAER